MIRAITGIGPRVGTSFVMQECIKAGLPVNFDPILEAMLPPEGNPGGYFEYNPIDLPGLTSGITKVWPLYLHMTEVEKVVLLQRESGPQYASIREQVRREGISCYPPHLVAQSLQMLTDWLPTTAAEVRIYRTEDLSSSINDILEFIGD